MNMALGQKQAAGGVWGLLEERARVSQQLLLQLKQHKLYSAYTATSLQPTLQPVEITQQLCLLLIEYIL